jgi:hypothetical protein
MKILINTDNNILGTEEMREPWLLFQMLSTGTVNI